MLGCKGIGAVEEIGRQPFHLVSDFAIPLETNGGFDRQLYFEECRPLPHRRAEQVDQNLAVWRSW